LLLAATLLGCGLSFGLTAQAQSEPTLNQVYEAAQSGRLDQAQVMMQQVLVAHPGSAKAHFVQAELFAKQGQIGRAREALGSAEKLAPGLPFAKADAVQNLRTQLAGKSSAGNPSNAVSGMSNSNATRAAASVAPAAPASSFPWGMALILGGGAIAVGIFMMRNKPVVAPAYGSSAQPAYANAASPAAMQGGLSGPQNFGMGMGAGAVAPAYGQQPGYGQPGQPGQVAGSGLGGKVMGGLAAGLAVGTGVMAAQAIGKSLMGNNEHPQNGNANNASGNSANGDYQPFAGNSDLGGQNFGVNDTSSWDDSSSVASSDSGGDWDS
jgi:TolA-binding protein